MTRKQSRGRTSSASPLPSPRINGVPESPFRPHADTEVAFRRLTSSIGGLLGTILELIWNSYDWGRCKHIWVLAEGRGRSYTLTVLDDGLGMNEYRRRRSMDLATAPDPKDVGKRNYQNLGLKRAGHDFESCRIETISKDDTDGLMRVWEFSWDNLFRLLSGKSGEEIVPHQVSQDATTWGLPAASTGTRVHLFGSREHAPRYTAETLIEILADHLPPWVAKLVYVNGLPLKVRPIVGDPLRWEENHPVLKRIQIHLYVPKTKSPRDELRVGAAEPICSWQQFRKQIPPEQWRPSLNIFSDGIYGDIYAEAFSDMIAPTRRDFEARLFTSPRLSELLDFLEFHVEPAVKRLIGVVEQQEKSRFQQRLLDDLQRYCGGVREGPPQPPVSVLQVHPPNIEVLVNRSAELEVVKCDPQLTIRWDDSESGGKIEKILDRGRKVVYRAGKMFGPYTLTCSYVEEPQTRRIVEVSIVERKVLKVHPARVKVAFGQEVILRAVNWKEDGHQAEDLRWKLDEEDAEGCFLIMARRRQKESPIGYDTEVRYRAGNTPGTFRIELYDERNRQQTYPADVTVGEAPARPGTGPKGNLLVLEGERYKLSFVEASTLPQLSQFIPARLAGEPNEIVMNTLHPAYRHVQTARGYAGCFELSLGQVILKHIDNVSDGDVAPADRTRRYGELYALMVENLEHQGSG